MKFKIPANTELEDKILPFLTVRQLIILTIWGVICYAVFQIFFSLGYVAWVWWTIDFFIWIFFLALAFLKINHLDFHRWLTLLISRIFIPQKRYFNNWVIWWLYFDVLTINLEQNKKVKEKQNNVNNKERNIDLIKNKIFSEEEKYNYNELDDYDEIKEFKKRFW